MLSTGHAPGAKSMQRVFQLCLKLRVASDAPVRSTSNANVPATRSPIPYVAPSLNCIGLATMLSSDVRACPAATVLVLPEQRLTPDKVYCFVETDRERETRFEGRVIGGYVRAPGPIAFFQS